MHNLSEINIVVVIIAFALLVPSIVLLPFQNANAQMDIILTSGYGYDGSADLLLEEEAVVQAGEENTASSTTTTTTTSEAANETTSTASASGINSNNTGEIKFLVIQTAESGTLSQINATTYALELRNVSDTTILFSDRPDRIVTSQSTSDFIGNWSQGVEDSFAVDPPNAVLIIDDDEEEQQRQEAIAIITLFNPAYDSETNTLKYDIIPENATTTTTPNTSLMELPTEFGQSTLIIDEIERLTNIQHAGGYQL